VDYDAVLRKLALTHNVFTGSAAIAAGVPEHILKNRVRKGQLERPYRGVYRVPGLITPEQSIRAAWLAAGPEADASHHSAVVLWDIPVPLELHMTVLGDNRRRIPGVTVHRATRLDPVDRATRAGITCSSPTRMLIDMAALVEEPLLDLLLDEVLSRHLAVARYIRRRMATIAPRRHNAAVLRRLLDERPEGRAKGTNKFERLLFELLQAAGLPLPVPQFRVVLPSGRKIFFDYAYPNDLVALEGDSYQYHSSRRAWANDRTRNAEATAIGWRIIPATWDDLTFTPQRVPTLVGQALDCRSRKDSQTP
jgi:hypothetical protein